MERSPDQVGVEVAGGQVEARVLGPRQAVPERQHRDHDGGQAPQCEQHVKQHEPCGSRLSL